MTKQHFEYAAKYIRELRSMPDILDYGEKENAAIELQLFCERFFKEFNSNFDLQRFREACNE